MIVHTRHVQSVPLELTETVQLLGVQCRRRDITKKQE